MSLEVRLARATDREAIARLDVRLQVGGASARVYPPDGESVGADLLPREEQYVVADGEEIRGSVYLRRTAMVVEGVRVPVGYVKYPIAESLVDRRFAGVPVAMIRHLQRVQPELLVMGMGGLDGPFASFLSRMRWRGHTIPTLVLPLRPTVLLRCLPHLASRKALVRLARGLDLIGAGAVLSGSVRLVSALGTRLLQSGSIVENLNYTGTPDPVYDRVFESALPFYPVIADRSSPYAAWMFPRDTQGAHRLQIRTSRGAEGYVHVQYLDLRTQAASPYGPLRLAVLHDMLAAPGAARSVIAAGVSLARQLGADLVLMNHSHSAWLRAAMLFGFIRGPNNFACLRSPALDERLHALGHTASTLYATRGDDGVLGFA